MSSNISFNGVISGLDTSSIINALLKTRRQPITQLERQAEGVYFEKLAFQVVNTRLLALKNATLNLRLESTFKRKSVTSSNSALLSATSGFDALNRSYSVVIDQVARGARAISGLNDKTLNRSAAMMMNGNTAGITGLTAGSTALGHVRATLNTLISDTVQAGEGSAVVTAGDTISIAGVLKNGVTSVNGTFTFAGNSTDTIQRLANTIEAVFQGQVDVTYGRNGELVLTEVDPSISGNVTLSSVTFNDVDFSGSTLTIGTGSAYAGGSAVANVVTGTKTFTTGSTAVIATSATLIQNLDQVTGTLDSGSDQINISGTDFDGTAVSSTYIFTASDTLNDLLTAINGIYTGATASIQNGRIVLTDTATGASQTSLDLVFDNNAPTTNTLELGLFTTAIAGSASTAQEIHTTVFQVPARGKHILTVTNGLGGQATGTVSLNPDDILSALGVTEPHLFTIDIDSGASGVEPVTIRGLNAWSTVQDLVEAVNTQAPGVTAGLVDDGGGAYFLQITSNIGGEEIRLSDGSGNGILENVLDPTVGVDTDYTTTNSSSATTDFTMVSRFQPSNNSGEQRYIYTGAEGTAVSSLITNFNINGGVTNRFDPGVAVIYTVEDSQLNLRPATDSHIIGLSGISDPSNTTHPPLNKYLSLREAGFTTTPENENDNPNYHTSGTFTINGVQITIEDVDTTSVNDVLGLINSSGAGVIAEYDATADRFILKRGDLGNTSPITVGGVGDTSNFLAIAGLVGGTGATSFTGAAAGKIDLDTSLSFTNMTLPPSAGTFTINGVTLYVDPSSETLRQLITKINNSAAGMTAEYDASQDRIVLTQKLVENPTFDQITIGALSDTSNILSSFRLTNSTISTTAIGSLREDARFTIDAQDYARNTNTVDDVITDVTLNLNGKTSSEPVSLNIEQDSGAGIDAIVNFVVLYNQLIGQTNPAQLSQDDRDAMKPLSDESAASMSGSQFDVYEAKRQELSVRDAILTADVIRRLNTNLQNSIFDPVKGVASGKLDRLSSLGINTGFVGLGIAKPIPYIVVDSEDPDEIRAAIENSTSTKSFIINKTDEIFNLFSKALKSRVSVTGNVDISSGIMLSNALSFRVGDGETFADINIAAGFRSKSQVLSAINTALGQTGFSGTYTATTTTNGFLKIEASQTSGTSRIVIVDLHGGTNIDDALGIIPASTLGDPARLNAGLARRLDSDIDSLTGFGGIINQRIRFGGLLDAKIVGISKRISDIEDRLALYELRIRRQYASLELALSRFQKTSRYLDQQAGSLSGTSTTSG